MGVRANALIDHRVADHRDQKKTISLLTSSLKAVCAVSDYWQTVQDYTETDKDWRVVYHPSEDYLTYHGPGGLMINFEKNISRIHASCRWSGFCTIAALQKIHVEAFRSLAHIMGGTKMILIPDQDHIFDIFFGGGTLDDCIHLLEQRWGPPHPKTEIIAEDDQIYYKRQFPPWYIEQI